MAKQVIDASVAVKWIVKDEPFRNESRRLLHDAKAKSIILCAPPIFRYEVESVIQNSLLRKRLDLETANASLAVFYAINIQIISHPDLVVCARNIARRFRQNKIYDSLYAALAQLQGCEFWTADKAFFDAVSPELQFVRYLPDYSL
jgi:predicted nucleic acid-binding protein